MNKNVWIFIKERVPFIANLILGLGMIFSVKHLFNPEASITSFIFVLAALYTFITELRFMDELKDHEKDKIAHPDRPLPRGLISPKQVLDLIVWTFVVLILFCISSYFLYGFTAALYLSITVLWLYLMYKEFFIGEGLAKMPFIYAITHQVVIIPAVLFVIAVFSPAELYTQKSLAFCLLILGSFFSFEVGRKLDPDSHPILGTYLVHYGRAKTYVMILGLLALTLIGGHLLNHLWWVLIPFILVVGTMVRLKLNPKIFDQFEGLIALNLIYNLWLFAISGWVS